MIRTNIKQKTNQLIEGPAGQLEVAYDEAIGVSRGAFGIVCHPNSQAGGSMQNKVVTTLSKTFQYLGVNVVRFNFRSVGQSEGEFDNGQGELDDLLAVIDWVQEERPPHELWLAGFSFGAYVAACAATKRTDVKKLVLVAPPVLNYSMDSLPPILCPWILAQGEQDEIVPADAVFAWAEKREPPPLILRFPEAGHFFHGQLVALRTRLEEVLLI
ncbi:MAG: hypothetical protein A3F12_04210 [Gammaproteobacteria bacterium RIFCSPHIGHO2_12_FULL_38_14]|nr:MAG: hypothetical protein A3F12_04210 [Gammaproteobacteria bacterium RIFCSPHIGHO2_12_FULL_38_14]